MILESVQQSDQDKPELQQAEAHAAQQLWENAKLATERHPILIVRDLTVPGLRVDRDGSLLLPICDSDRKIKNVGFIRVVGKMEFLHDHVRGLYFALDGQRDVIYIVRGLYNGACCHRTTARAVAVVFDQESVEIVAEMMQGRHPRSKIVVAPAPIASTKSPLKQLQSASPAALIHPTEQTQLSWRSSESSTLPTPQAEGAQLLLRWIHRRQLTELTRKQVMQYGPNSIRQASRAKAALRELVESGWLVTEDDSRYVLTPGALATFRAEPSAPAAAATAVNDLVPSS